jgi:hypothetical protein
MDIRPFGNYLIACCRSFLCNQGLTKVEKIII